MKRIQYSAKEFDDNMGSFINLQPDDVDALLASELTNMSVEERGSIYEEVHGVDKEIVETPQLLEESLRLMEAALQQQVPRLRDLYNQARQINPKYVDSQSFWLQFLRAERFVAPKAALRLCRFLESKVKFFGSDSLARSITLEDDFDPDDLAWLKSGINQLLPSRDRSGRMVIGVFNMKPDFVQPLKIDSVVCICPYTSSSDVLQLNIHSKLSLYATREYSSRRQSIFHAVLPKMR
jgi:hypothetical protein